MMPRKANVLSHRVYFLLGAFNVLTVLASLALCERLLGQYDGSVRENAEWAARISIFGEIRAAVTAADAPGNELFRDGDVGLARTRLKNATLRADQRFDDAARELGRLAPADNAPLLAELARARDLYTRMIGEASVTIDAYERHEREKAGESMAAMDSSFAQTSESLNVLRVKAQRLQSSRFEEQLASARSGRALQLVALVLVVFMVMGVIAYGLRLGRVLATQQAKIDARNEDMRIVLSNVDQGLFTLDLDGRVVGDASNALAALLGPMAEGTRFWTHLAAIDEEAATWFEVNWVTLVEDALPVEVCLHQLPHRVARGDRTLHLEYKAILDHGRLSRVLVVVSDVTRQVQNEALEAEQRELLAVFDRIMKDKAGFLEFFSEADGLVRAIAAIGDRDLTVVKRELHTLKGNAAMFGLGTVATVCHALEDRLDDSFVDLTAGEARRLTEHWARLAERIRTLCGERRDSDLVLDAEEYDALLRCVRSGVPQNVVTKVIEELRFEPSARRLERLAEGAQRTGVRLRKGELEVISESNGLRFARETWAPFWAAVVHVVRNAVDHGVEAPDQRAAAGKSRRAHLALRTRLEGAFVHVDVEDDGPGVNWEALVERARARGATGSLALDAGLFADGLSTLDRVTEVSGRGVGMAAAKAACEAMGGHMEVRSERGKGTLVRLVVPAHGVGVLAPAPAGPSLVRRASEVPFEART